MAFLHDLARFDQLARANCPAGLSDFVHFGVKIVVKKSGFREGFYAVNFLMVLQYSILFR